MKGRSDQAGWRSTHWVSGAVSCPNKPSSARKTTPAPVPISAIKVVRSAQMSVSSLALRKSSAEAGASRPIGAKMRTRQSRSALLIDIVAELRDLIAGVARVAREDAAEARERRAEHDAGAAQAEFADRVLMVAAALLHDGERAPHRSRQLEVAQHHDCVAQIADVERRLHRSDQAVLRQHQDGQHALLAEITQQLVHLQDEEALVRHGVHVTVQAVDDDNAGAL